MKRLAQKRNFTKLALSVVVRISSNFEKFIDILKDLTIFLKKVLLATLNILPIVVLYYHICSVYNINSLRQIVKMSHYHVRLDVWRYYALNKLFLRLVPIILILRLEESPDTVPSYINNVCIPETPSQFKGNRKEKRNQHFMVAGQCGVSKWLAHLPAPQGKYCIVPVPGVRHHRGFFTLPRVQALPQVQIYPS